MDPKRDSIYFVFNTHADLYHQKFGQLEALEDAIHLFCKHLSNQASVLELGCGPGNVLKYINDLMPNVQLEGWDIAENMIEIAKNSLPNHLFKVKDAEQFLNENRRFEGLVFSFCAPYISSSALESVLLKINDQLVDGGVLMFATMIGRADSSGWFGEGERKLYTYIHEEKTLRNLFTSLSWKTLYEKKNAVQNGVGDMDWLVVLRKS